MPDRYKEGRYQEGSIVTGTVKERVPYGVFVQLDDSPDEALLELPVCPEDANGKAIVPVVGDRVKGAVIAIKSGQPYISILEEHVQKALSGAKWPWT